MLIFGSGADSQYSIANAEINNSWYEAWTNCLLPKYMDNIILISAGKQLPEYAAVAIRVFFPKIVVIDRSYLSHMKKMCLWQHLQNGYIGYDMV